MMWKEDDEEWVEEESFDVVVFVGSSVFGS